MKKAVVLMLDLFFLTRPVVLVPVWGFSAFGIYRFKGELFLNLGLSRYLLMTFYSLSVASVYIINQIADCEVDKSNGGFPLFARSGISTKTAGVFAAVCAFLSITGPLAMKNASVAFLSLLAITAGYIYSCKPFSLSGRPFFDFLTNGFEAFLAFAAGWCIIGGNITDPLLLKSAAPYFLLMCSGSISSTLPDMPGDHKHNKITTAVRFGAKPAHCIATAALVTAACAAALNSDPLALWCALLVLPIYILYLIHTTALTMELTYKAGGTLTMMAAALAAPLIVPAGLLIFFFTWLYFRKRHNVSYPSLVPDS
ncbi:MAG: UbiA family prenyltransferase [Chitinispirillales bacterium]|jgi:4-hydroxybenzoate polyprenyltransferase|nr:UbiA family prenyltransferase [Chitinispirillales bacterium]